MPFNMFKAFSSGSRSRAHPDRGDPTIYNDYPQGYPPGADFQPDPMSQSQPRVLRRSSTKRREPVFTPLPSRTPSDADDYNDGYIRVDSPEAVMGGALNARPSKMDSILSPIESAVSESLSEREHREHAERLHDTPRLSDRPPPLQRAGSFHSGRGERIDPDNPIMMGASQSRLSGSGSDHTVEGLRTPSYPSERVIPPLPRTHSAGYAPGSRSPTDIYASHAYGVARSGHSHHNTLHRDRYSYEKDRPIYYVIPGGMNVIFQDEHGNEITRVGDFSRSSQPARPGPFMVQDEYGRELYRYDGYDRGSQRGYSEPQIVRIDAYPPSSQFRRDRSYSSHSYRPDHTHRRGGSYDCYPDERGYRDYRERDWRDHRDHRYRGYVGYSDDSDYRDHRGHRDRGVYRDSASHRGHGGYREHDGHRDHGDHRLHERSETYAPSRVSSRASHRTHTAQISPPQQYPSAISDDRRSLREYAASHTSMRPQEDESDLNAGMQELQI